MTKRKASIANHKRKLIEIQIVSLTRLMESCYRQLLQLEAERAELVGD